MVLWYRTYLGSTPSVGSFKKCSSLRSGQKKTLIASVVFNGSIGDFQSFGDGSSPFIRPIGVSYPYSRGGNKTNKGVLCSEMNCCPT